MPSKVYFLPASENEGHDILAEKTRRIFGALGLDASVEKDAFVGIKIHFGEKGNTGFIKPPWLRYLIDDLKKQKAKVFLTDTNTLYLGNRSNSVEHLQLATQHGFSSEALGVPVIIADGLIGKESGEVEVNLKHVKSAKIASAFFHTDLILCLSQVSAIFSFFKTVLSDISRSSAIFFID